MTAPAAGGLARRPRDMSLGMKLALFSALVTALVVSVAFVVLRVRTERDVSRVFSAELRSRQRGLQQLQDRNLRLLLATSSLVTTSPTLHAAMGTLRTETNSGLPARKELLRTIEREATGIFRELDRDLLVVTDDSGRVLASVARPEGAAPAAGISLIQVPSVRYALMSDGTAADSAIGVLRTPTGALQVGCVPILQGGYPIGALLLGERLERLMPSLDTVSGTQAVVTAGGIVLASSLASAPVGTRWTEEPERAAPDAESAELMRFAGAEYVAAMLPLGRTEDGAPATLHLVRSLSDALAPINRSLGRSFLLAGVVAVLLVGSGTAVVSRGALSPLSRFVAFLRAGASAGTYDRFAGPYATPEIGTLADAYNGLIASLSEQHEQLGNRTGELAAAIETLQDEVRERERTEQALRDSEEQLRQSQKLEALGTLAGGVAHDFNNLLSVIQGYAQLAAAELPKGSRSREDIGQIGDATRRAGELVRQLLAFSRKQVLQPQIVDLNHIVPGMQALLRPLIGEDMHLETRLGPDLQRITADPGQLEQVVLNLVVNARDAMPTGGTITVETKNVQLDERYEHRPDHIPGGPVVMLAVTDTGIGMDAQTRSRIFEPFFTTKAPGKGTGLGLATVYGIVRQSGGSITVYSEPGRGTTFRCYFPVATAKTRAAAAVVDDGPAAGGTETVLVAEDNAQLRAMVRRALEGRGYRVLEAADGREAMAVAGGHEEKIHLLVTDVVMPHISGKELAERLLPSRPGLRVLFMSGYSTEAIERHGELAPDSVFLQKPIDPASLARAVRDILDDATAAPRRGG